MKEYIKKCNELIATNEYEDFEIKFPGKQKEL